MKKRIILIIVLCFIALLLCAVIAFLLVWNGVILLNDPSTERYPVRGIDVSHYQGEIDWQVLSKQKDISFAFIKATEGSSYVDPKFEYNFSEARKTGLRVGAYHFFSFESPGVTQAESFIAAVGSPKDMLPPVIDLELYGEFTDKKPNAEDVRLELSAMIVILHEQYGVMPIIYVSEDTYDLYVKGHFKGCDIWWRNVISSRGLPDGRQWTFWQYTNRETLKGYHGKERYIDMNVFFGTMEEFKLYGVKND